MKQDKTVAHRVGHRGAEHVGLRGASKTFLYRPSRLEAKDLGSPLTCVLVHAAHTTEPMTVLDISPTGLGIELDDATALTPGTLIDEVRLIQDDATVASERAIVVNLLEGPPRRLGLRLISGLLDLRMLQLRDMASTSALETVLETQRTERELLPPQWRAAVADLAQLLKRTADFFDQIEAAIPGTQATNYERNLFEELFPTWGAEYHSMLRELHALTIELPAEVRTAGLDYAAHLLLPLVYIGPAHRRAYDKPQGYAGDFELMRLFFTPVMEGDTLFARFLHYSAQRYPTAHTVVSRERTLREILRERIRQERPLRILSLACGPALEIQHVLAEVTKIRQPIDLYLLDQDEDALAHAHRAVRHVLADRREALAKVRLSALHFSVMQLLRPRDEAEVAVARDMLRDMDLIYSSGLFDYLPHPVARRLVQRLYGRLRDGGELFLGNLREDPASSWMMEHATAWHLIYREPPQMLALAEGLDPEPTDVGLVLDRTERCMFLHVARPAP
ncbi:hypothetical protein OEB96_18335 [Paraliomyxa miuraensis]|nr:hypothetical protein [Paraliomyxa miuraensis]